MKLANINDVRAAEPILRRHFSPTPLIRSYPLERALGLSAGRQVWIKDYGFSPVGSFKLMGALNWVAHHVDEIGDRPIVAHSSGNFASGIAFAAKQYGKRLIVVMPDTAPQVKFERTRSLGAETRTYDKARDHLTGDRERMAREIAENENAVPASPYDDLHVIAGNGVGGLEIAEELRRQGRSISHFVCAVSGGGLMAGHALAIADAFPACRIVGVEPASADDFAQSLARSERTSIQKPESICDGLLSYDVGNQNWPILKALVSESVSVPDEQTMSGMKWLYEQHGLKAEPSGAITIAAALAGHIDFAGDGDLVLVLSGRNVDEEDFRKWVVGSGSSMAANVTGLETGPSS